MSAVPSGITSCATTISRYIHLANRTAFKYSPELLYPEWTMLICEDGLVEYRVGDRSGTARAGDLVLCPPGEVLQRKALTTIAFQFAIFELQCFSGDEAVPFPYYGKYSFPQMQPFLSFAERMKASRERISIRYTEHLLNDVLYQIVYDQSKPDTDLNPIDPLIDKALHFIHQHVFDAVSTQAAADYAGLHQSSFTRRFQKATGSSPSAYIAKLRLQKAAALLIESDSTLESIAQQCGYQNGYYLSRVFSKAMNMSPSQYRLMHRV